MNWRMKLADWISGGELARLTKKQSAGFQQAHKWIDKFYDSDFERCELRFSLRKIAAMETPSANATVCRMAKTAREALTPPATP